MINGYELAKYFSEVEDEYYYGQNLYSDAEIDEIIDAAYEAGYREAMFSDDEGSYAGAAGKGAAVAAAAAGLAYGAGKGAGKYAHSRNMKFAKVHNNEDFLGKFDKEKRVWNEVDKSTDKYKALLEEHNKRYDEVAKHKGFKGKVHKGATAMGNAARDVERSISAAWKSGNAGKAKVIGLAAAGLAAGAGVGMGIHKLRSND